MELGGAPHSYYQMHPQTHYLPTTMLSIMMGHHQKQTCTSHLHLRACHHHLQCTLQTWTQAQLWR